MWFDATYEKVRQGARIVSHAAVVAVGVRDSGEKSVLGMAIGASETEAFWVEFCRSLARRERVSKSWQARSPRMGSSPNPSPAERAKARAIEAEDRHQAEVMPPNTNRGPSVGGGWIRLGGRKLAVRSCRDEVVAALQALRKRTGTQMFTVRDVYAERWPREPAT